ncbi:MAG: hypothetical protein ACYTG5_16945 [Planctomycetota bacterium]|jgi:hypothetical protein
MLGLSGALIALSNGYEPDSLIMLIVLAFPGILLIAWALGRLSAESVDEMREGPPQTLGNKAWAWMGLLGLLALTTALLSWIPLWGLRATLLPLGLGLCFLLPICLAKTKSSSSD